MEKDGSYKTAALLHPCAEFSCGYHAEYGGYLSPQCDLGLLHLRLCIRQYRFPLSCRRADGCCSGDSGAGTDASFAEEPDPSQVRIKRNRSVQKNRAVFCDLNTLGLFFQREKESFQRFRLFGSKILQQGAVYDLDGVAQLFLEFKAGGKETHDNAAAILFAEGALNEILRLHAGDDAGDGGGVQMETLSQHGGGLPISHPKALQKRVLDGGDVIGLEGVLKVKKNGVLCVGQKKINAIKFHKINPLRILFQVRSGWISCEHSATYIRTM